MEDSPQPLDGNLGAHVLHVEQEGVEGRPQVPAVPHSEGRHQLQQLTSARPCPWPES